MVRLPCLQDLFLLPVPVGKRKRESKMILNSLQRTFSKKPRGRQTSLWFVLLRSSLDHAWSGSPISMGFPLKFWRDFSTQGTADSGCTPCPNIPAVVCSNVSTNRLPRGRSPFYVKLRFPGCLLIIIKRSLVFGY